MPKRFVHEILEQLVSCKTDQEKVVLLQKNNNLPLRKVLAINYNPKINFIVEGEIKYEPNTAPSGLAQTNLYRESRRLYLFLDINGLVKKLSPKKRLNMYEMLLESLHAGEAEVLEMARSRKLGEKYGLTLEIVKAAFPGMLPEDAVEPETVERKTDDKPKKTRRSRKPKQNTESGGVSSE